MSSSINHECSKGSICDTHHLPTWKDWCPALISLGLSAISLAVILKMADINVAIQNEAELWQRLNLRSNNSQANPNSPIIFGEISCY